MRHPPSRLSQRGFTLVEVLVAGAILALLTCALLEGIIVAVKVSHETSQHLAAEALAFDLAWLHFNRDWDSDLKKAAAGTTTVTYNNAGDLAPTLANANATARVRLSPMAGISGVLIHSEVSWGTDDDNRLTVSHDVFRGSMSRVPGSR